ncbi:MAG: T9SS type A sorting domain-containing protein [Phycisphaerae bacterium]|nr:T9SS type A sorting domain-containing protein [Saprospiraceae bacterium]
MYIKNLFLFACLLAATLLGANNAPVPVTSPVTSIVDGGLCNLPAPFLFHIEEVGTTWVMYAWGGNAANEHRIRTYRASDNALLNTTNVPPGNGSAVINNLPHGTEVYGIINTICSNGDNSPNEAQSAPIFTLIMDLIVNGVQAPEGQITCVIQGPGGYCEFSGAPDSITIFRVRSTKPASTRAFGMNRTGSSNPQYHAYFEKSNNDDNSIFDFRCELANSGPNCDGPTQGQIWYSSTPIAIFTPSQTTQTISKLHVSGLGSNYRVEKLGTFAYGFRPLDPSRGASVGLSPSAIQASPNPFSDFLDVFPGNTSAEKITLQLYSLSGQKVLGQQFLGGQEQYTLSTAGLSNGFYLLRIEADGEVQTMKVVKSE